MVERCYNIYGQRHVSHTAEEHESVNESLSQCCAQDSIHVRIYVYSGFSPAHPQCVAFH